MAGAPDAITPDIEPDPHGRDDADPAAGRPVDGGDAETMELLIEPDDAAGDRDWTIDIGSVVSPVDPDLIDRFARRLNRAKGVTSAQRVESQQVHLRMNKFGHSDLDSVEALVHRVWDQTKATHRGSVLAGSPGS